MAVAVNIKANIEMENLVFLPGASGNIDFWRPVIKQLPRSYQSTIFTYPEFGGAEAHAAVNDFDGLQRYILERIVKGSNIRESSISDGVVEENHVQDANVLVESVPTANMQKIRAQDPHLQDAIMLENSLQPVNFNIQDLKAIGTLTGHGAFSIHSNNADCTVNGGNICSSSCFKVSKIDQGFGIGCHFGWD